MDQSPGADSSPPSAAPRNAKARLDALAAPVRARLRLAAACAVFGGWLLIAQAAAIAWTIQRALAGGADASSLWPALAALLGVGLARTLLAAASRELADTATTRLRARLRRDLARRLLGAGAPWLRRRRSGALSELVGTHVDALEGHFGGYAIARAEALLVPPAMLVAAFALDPVVGAVLLATVPLMPAFMLLVGRGAEAASRRQLRALSRMGGHFADRLRGLGTIRVYGRGEDALAGIRAAAEGLRERSLKVLRLAFLSSAVLEFFASVSVAVIALYLGLGYLGMIELGAPTDLGTGAFLLLLAPEFYAPMRRLAAHYHDRAGALAAVEEIAGALEGADDATAARPEAAGALGPRRAPAIRLDAASLRHPGAPRDAVHALSLRIAPGERVALVGGSGSGKSTVLEAIAGWLPAREGAVALDPPDARIGYAPQRPFLFHGSIADNLRLARPDADDEAVRAAAGAAQVLRFAERLPRGLDTVIGERGFGLSGGEARRIALARVFLRDPALLLLDEPTAFLDPATEARVLAALADYARGRTLVIATHSRAALAIVGRAVALEPAR